MKRIRIFIADDHGLVATAIASLLEREPDLVVQGVACDGRDLLERVEEAHPDVVLMDVAMPGLGGVETTRRLLKRLPDVRVLALSQQRDRDPVFAMIKAGAAGYVLKSDGTEGLVNAIRRVATGERYVSPTLSGFLVDAVLAQPHDVGAGGAEDRLTPREVEILQRIAEGRTTPEIAEDLSISRRTVDTHRQRIMDKLGVRSVAGLTKWAIRLGLTPGDP